MPKFSFQMPEYELELLNTHAKATSRRKSDVVRELIRTLAPSPRFEIGVPQPPASGKLTKADVARVVYSLWNAGYIFMPEAQSNLTKEAFLNTVIEEMIKFDLEVED